MWIGGRCSQNYFVLILRLAAFVYLSLSLSQVWFFSNEPGYEMFRNIVNVRENPHLNSSIVARMWVFAEQFFSVNWWSAIFCNFSFSSFNNEFTICSALHFQYHPILFESRILLEFDMNWKGSSFDKFHTIQWVRGGFEMNHHIYHIELDYLVK